MFQYNKHRNEYQSIQYLFAILISNTNINTPISSLEIGEIFMQLETNSINNSTLC